MEPYPRRSGERALWSGTPTRRRRWFVEYDVMLHGGLLITSWPGGPERGVGQGPWAPFVPELWRFGTPSASPR